MKKMVHPRPLAGMNDSMEWSHASLDHVRRRSSRKRAVAGSSSSQTSVNSEPLVVQDDPQGTPPSVDDMFSADPYANRFLYTGREFLKEANLYDYRNRVYSAELGRFFQSDPIRFDAGDLNLYRYVCNSSVIKTYPLGLEEKCCKSGNWGGDVIYSVVAGVIGPGVFNGSVTCTDDINMKASIAGIMLGWGGGYSTGSTNLNFSGAKKPSDLVGKQDLKIMVGVQIFGIGGRYDSWGLSS
jgi:RHS repeat-associated protein